MDRSMDMQGLVVRRVVLSRDVAHVCLSHALSTEHQEIMGLLLGRVVEGEVLITRSLILSRKDRQKDRVEVGDELVALSSTVAEKLSAVDGFEEKVVGWYHSHPHITVMPSHVDVRTQGNYQQLDSAFIGLIFSVFDKGRFDVCAFQSKTAGSDWCRVEVPVVVRRGPNTLEGMASLQQVILNEEVSARANVSPSSSVLEKCRLCCVYQSAMLRIMDHQLLPTLLSLRSRRRSLELQLHLKKSQLTTDNDDIRSTTTPPLSSNGLEGPGRAPVHHDLKLSGVLLATESLTAEWTHRAACLQLLAGGIRVILGTGVECLPGLLEGMRGREDYVLRVSPTAPLSLGETCRTCSPWILCLHTAQQRSPAPHSLQFPLLSLGPSSVPADTHDVTINTCLCQTLTSGPTQSLCCRGSVAITVTVLGAVLPSEQSHLSPNQICLLLCESLQAALHLDLT